MNMWKKKRAVDCKKGRLYREAVSRFLGGDVEAIYRLIRDQGTQAGMTLQLGLWGVWAEERSKRGRVRTCRPMTGREGF